MKNKKNNLIFISATLNLLTILCFSCNNDKINGKYHFLVDGGVGRFSGSNIIRDRKDVYPNVVKIEYNTDFILLKQVPNKEKHKLYLGNDLYSIHLFYSKYMQDSSTAKKWDGLKNDSIIYNIFKSRGASTENTSNDIQIRLRVADSLINHDPEYKKIFANDTNYWIIYEARDTLIGPLTKMEYISKRKKLNIPENLILD